MVAIVDIDVDGVLTIGEVVVGINRILVPVSDETILGMNEEALISMADLFGVSVSKQEFVTGWMNQFYDCEDFVSAVFDAFDDNKDGALNVRELEGILGHVRLVSGNYDQTITTQEFHDFFMWVSLE
nr:hypothetical protein BaRGS_020513 [Batillaria attramentaria]